MQWLIDNMEWIFSGIGAVIGGWIFKVLFQKKKATAEEVINQSQNGGNHSTNIQGGNNVTVTKGDKIVKK